ncbi:MAG: tetratricopeptide repeat protein, partial [Gammaproteobacteria bacterium]
MAVYPFNFLPWSDEPAAQLRCAKTFIKDKLGPGITPFSPNPSQDNGPIRVVYLSADFHQHATAHLVTELFELHDRKRFAVVGISFGPDDGTPLRQRLARAFDEFIDARTFGDQAVAELLLKKNVHIAVDLKGYTTDCRPEIFAWRPAPVQVNYLGYPGTMGAEFIDYIVVDPFVVPLEQQPFYTEKLVQLPDCYQVNDRKRQIADVTPSRMDCGLPAEGFVYCCFNYSYKITPDIFTIWMRLLTEVPGSVLWLLKDNEQMEMKLRREAAARGVEPERLVFAPRRPLAEHLARQRLADLFLDTLPVNAHTTASDALWAGLPVLTCAGKSFAARVAGSLLQAVGLPELVTDKLEAYESLALA